MWLRNKKTGGLFNTDNIKRKLSFNLSQVNNMKDKEDFVAYGTEEAYKALDDFKKARAKAEKDRKLLKSYKDRLKYNSDPWGNPLSKEQRESYRESVETASKYYNNSKRDKKVKELIWLDEVKKYKKSAYGQINILDKKRRY